MSKTVVKNLVTFYKEEILPNSLWLKPKDYRIQSRLKRRHGLQHFITSIPRPMETEAERWEPILLLKQPAIFPRRGGLLSSIEL